MMTIRYSFPVQILGNFTIVFTCALLNGNGYITRQNQRKHSHIRFIKHCHSECHEFCGSTIEPNECVHAKRFTEKKLRSFFMCAFVAFFCKRHFVKKWKLNNYHCRMNFKWIHHYPKQYLHGINANAALPLKLNIY